MKDRKRKGLQGITEAASTATSLLHEQCDVREDSSVQVVSQPGGCFACRFMIGSSDSDSEDDKRVIRSAKDRRFDELQATCHEIRVRRPTVVLLLLHTLVCDIGLVHVKQQSLPVDLPAPTITH